jgi:cytoskeletal protein CcmA (bactofilin family)
MHQFINEIEKFARLIIWEGVVINGDVKSDGSLIVEGEVNGTISCPDITVCPSGSIEGDIVGGNVVIEGHLKGNIEAQSISIVRQGVVRGDIASQLLSIEHGALFDGTVRKLADQTKKNLPSLTVRTAA